MKIQPLTIAAGACGSFSAQIYFGGLTYRAAGSFNAEGEYSGSIHRAGQLPIDYTFILDAQTGAVSGTFVLNGSVLSSLSADRVSSSSAGAQPGYYTIVIPPDTSEPANSAPPGYGIGTAIRRDTRGEIPSIGGDAGDHGAERDHVVRVCCHLLQLGGDALFGKFRLD